METTHPASFSGLTPGMAKSDFLSVVARSQLLSSTATATPARLTLLPQHNKIMAGLCQVDAAFLMF
jgi:hypothetical protein